MQKDPKLVFITHWRLNDWGFYNRRNEALLWELSRRDCVESVLHVEHVPLKGVIYKIWQWLKTKDAFLRKAIAIHIKKGISPWPVRVSDKHYVFSVLELYSGEAALLRKLSAVYIKLQYGSINSQFGDPKKKVVLIAYPPSQYLIDSIELIKHDVLIADIVDDEAARISDVARKLQLLENYKQILSMSRWIFATSPSINERYKEYAGKRIDFIPNGVDVSAFSFAAKENALSGRSQKIVGYVGALNSTMDMELLKYLVSQFAEVDFKIIGFCSREQLGEIQELTRQHCNFHYLGARSYHEVPKLLSDFDVLISPKKADHMTIGNDSMKIYEYLATGKPVVTTPVAPATLFADIIYVAGNKEEFADCLRSALQENDDTRRRMRIEASRENGWARRVDVILDRVSGLV
jgi:glycosyltransferase involved in cell wall biosynthesis